METKLEYLTSATLKRDPPKYRYGANVYGYGDKIATEWKVQAHDSKRPTLWRRVYAICWSNAATCYVTIDGRTVYVDTVSLFNGMRLDAQGNVTNWEDCPN